MNVPGFVIAFGTYSSVYPLWFRFYRFWEGEELPRVTWLVSSRGWVFEPVLNDPELLI